MKSLLFFLFLSLFAAHAQEHKVITGIVLDEKENILFKYDTLPMLPAGDIRIGFEIVQVMGEGVLVFPLYSTHSFHRSVSLDDYKRSSFGIKASVYVRQ